MKAQALRPQTSDRQRAERGRTAPSPGGSSLAVLAESIRTSPVMQARAAATRAMFGTALDTPAVQRAARPNRTGLPDTLKANVEALSGFAMDDVRVHRNSPKPAQLQAHAYAQGTEIHLASGQEKHLPHEAWHVVQQKQGRVRPTMQLKGVGVNDDAGLEREADHASRKMEAMGQHQAPLVRRKALRNGLGRTQTRLSLRDGTGDSIQRVIVGPAQDDIWASEIEAETNKLEDGDLKSQIELLQRDSKQYRVYGFKDLVAQIKQGPISPVPDASNLEGLDVAFRNLLKGQTDLMTQQKICAALVEKTNIDGAVIDAFLNENESFAIHTIENARPMGARGMLGHHAFIAFADGSIAEWAGPVTKLKYYKSQTEHRTVNRWKVANLKIAARKLGNRGQSRYFQYDLESATHGGQLYFIGVNDCFTWVNSVLDLAGLPHTTLVRITWDRLLVWLSMIASVGTGATVAYARNRK